MPYDPCLIVVLLVFLLYRLSFMVSKVCIRTPSYMLEAATSLRRMGYCSIVHSPFVTLEDINEYVKFFFHIIKKNNG